MWGARMPVGGQGPDGEWSDEDELDGEGEDEDEKKTRGSEAKERPEKGAKSLPKTEGAQDRGPQQPGLSLRGPVRRRTNLAVLSGPGFLPGFLLVGRAGRSSRGT